MTPRQYLELAARAMNIGRNEMKDRYWENGQLAARAWNPYVHLDDALRIAIHLNIGIRFYPTHITVDMNEAGLGLGDHGVGLLFEPYTTNTKESMTCRAIVRAAALIQQKRETKP